MAPALTIDQVDFVREVGAELALVLGLLSVQGEFETSTVYRAPGLKSPTYQG